MNKVLRISEPADMTTAELRSALKWAEREAEKGHSKKPAIVAEMDRRGLVLAEGGAP